MENMYKINTELDVPIYRQLVDSIHAAVKKGDLPAGHQLPTVQEMTQSLGIRTLSFDLRLVNFKKFLMIRHKRLHSITAIYRFCRYHHCNIKKSVCKGLHPKNHKPTLL